MKRLKKGFTLIELLVVIAIIGILATTLAPKLREQLAKAKDSKAIAVLGAGRTAAGVIFVDKMVQTVSGTVPFPTLTEIHDKLDPKAQGVYNTAATVSNGELIIGGSRGTPTGDMIYGGSVTLVIPTVSTTSESIELNFGASTNLTATTHSTEGKDWTAY